MDSHKQKGKDEANSKAKSVEHLEQGPSQFTAESTPAQAYQRVSSNLARPGDILALQRTVGNRAVRRMLAAGKRPADKQQAGKQLAHDAGSVKTAMVQRHPKNDPIVEDNQARIAVIRTKWKSVINDLGTTQDAHTNALTRNTKSIANLGQYTVGSINDLKANKADK